MSKNLKAIAKEKVAQWQFLHACENVRRKHNTLNNFRLKILKTCLRDMDEIGIPVTAKEKELMQKMLNLYDETLDELREDANRFRGYVDLDDKE